MTRQNSEVYKLAAVDLDGTLLRHGSNGDEISGQHPVRQSFVQAQIAGKFIAAATGRNYPKARSVLKAFGIIGPSIVNGGSQIIDSLTGELLWERRLDINIGASIIEHIQKTRSDNDLVLGLGHLAEKPINDVSDLELDDLIYLDIIGISSEKERDKLIEMINNNPSVEAGFSSSPQFPGRSNIFVTDAKATKYGALRQLQSILDVTKQETIVAGDGNNDMPLFKASGLKAAVQDGNPDLIAAADIVIASYTEYGVATLINTYMLGR